MRDASTRTKETGAGALITIHRAARRTKYTIIDNRILNDPSLSLEAKGLLAHLLSRPDDWNISLDQLSNQHHVGRDKIQRIMRELREAGYARLDSKRDPNTGHLSGKVWVIVEQPDAANREPENPAVGANTESLKNRPSEKPTVGKSGPILITESLPNTDSNQPPNPHAAKARDDGPAFEEFERAYPFLSIHRREPARVEFAKLSPEDRRAAIECAARYADECRKRDYKVCSPQRWLRERGWEGFLARRGTGVGSAPQMECAFEKPLAQSTRGDSIWIEEDSAEGKSWISYTLVRQKTRPIIIARRDGSRGFYRRSPFPPGYGSSASLQGFRGEARYG